MEKYDNVVTLGEIISAVKPSEVDLHNHCIEEGIGAEMIAYNEIGLAICGVVKLVCDRPRLAFARALGLWEEPELQSSESGVTLIDSFYAQGPYKIGPNCVIGGRGFGFERDEDNVPYQIPHLGNVVFGEHVELGSCVCIDRAVIGSTVIGDNVKIDNLVHVAHGAKIGKNTLIVAGSIIGGSVEIGENCFIGMNVSIKQKVKIGNGVTVGAGAVVLKNVPNGSTVVGNPARYMSPQCGHNFFSGSVGSRMDCMECGATNDL